MPSLRLSTKMISFPHHLQLSVAYSATNSATIDIPGLVEPDSMIYLTQNGDSAGKLKASADGTFVFLGIALKSGSNSFQSIASDASENQSKPSSTINITFSDKCQRLTSTIQLTTLKYPLRDWRLGGHRSRKQINH